MNEMRGIEALGRVYIQGEQSRSFYEVILSSYAMQNVQALNCLNLLWYFLWFSMNKSMLLKSLKKKLKYA